MGELSIYHWLIVAFILILFFGARRIPEVMKGVGEGIRSFQEGLRAKPPDKGSSEGANNQVDSK